MIWEVDQRERSVEGIGPDGRPDPAYAAALGLVRAPFGRRALAFACDVAIWLVLQLPLWLGAVPLLLKLATGSISTYGFVNHPDFVLAVVMAAVSVVLMLVYAIVQWVLHGRKGVTIGKAIAGIRSVNVRTLARPGMGAVLLRLIIVGAFGLVPVVGPVAVLVSPTFDPRGRGRGWHDSATGLWLVDVRTGLNPYDEKRMRIARKTVAAEPVAERSELPSLATPRDPAVQPEYRPGTRISAGVLGVARREAGDVIAAPAVPATPSLASSAPGPASVPVPAPGPASVPVPAPVAVPAPMPAVEPPAPMPAVQTPAPAPFAVPPAPAAPRRLAIRLDTGEAIAVDGPILVGRAPDAVGHPGARPIAIADESRSLSKTHALLRPAGSGLEIVDCRSTNGCAVVRGGVEHQLEPDVPVAVHIGDQIHLGDRTAEIIDAHVAGGAL